MSQPYSIPHHPYELIPKELWLIIFEYLKDKDVINCGRANLAWNELLNEQKTGLLFNEILPIVVKKNKKLGQEMRKQDLMRLRLVCKKWHDGFLHFFESCVQHEGWDSDLLYNFMVHIFSPEQLTTRGLPPLGSCLYGYVRVKVASSHFPPPSLLTLFGYQVKRLQLFVRFVGPTQYLEKAVPCLGHFSNIQVLEIRGKEISYDLPSLTKEARVHEWGRQIFRVLRRFPLPNLPLLEALSVYIEADFENCGGLHNTFVHRYASQLKVLEIHGEGPIALPQLPALQNLSTLISSLNEWERVLELESSIETLSLHICIDFSVEKLFQIVNQFEKSLVKLVVSGRSVNGHRSSDVEIKSDKFKSLSLNVDGNMPLSFLTHFTDIRSLHLNIKWAEDEKVCDINEELMRLKALFDTETVVNKEVIYDCQIWMKLPRLRTLVLTDLRNPYQKKVKATREIYEYLSKKNL